MTMDFVPVSVALAAMLNSQAGGSFRTLDYQRQITNIEQVLDGQRSVQVFYDSGDFDKRKGSRMGPCNHEMTFRIELYLSKASEIDLAAFEAAVDAAGRAAAISGRELASQLVNLEADQFMSDVYQILMDTRNDNLELDFPWGTPAGSILLANTWVSNMRKDSPIGNGEYSGLTGVVTFQCDVREGLLGETPLEMTEGIDDSISVNADPELTSDDEATPIAGGLYQKP